MVETGHALLQVKTGEDSVTLDNGNEGTGIEPMTVYAMFTAAEVTCKSVNENKWVTYATTIAKCSAKGVLSAECAEQVCELSECCKLGKNTLKEWKEAVEDDIPVDILQISAGENSSKASTQFDVKEVVEGMEKLCKKKNDEGDTTESKMQAAMKACLPKFSHEPRNTKKDSTACRDAICEMSECCKSIKSGYECLENIFETIKKWKGGHEVIDLDNEEEVEKYLKRENPNCLHTLFPKWR